MRKNLKPIKLNKEEKQILESFENGEWKSVANFTKEKKIAQKTASKTLYKKII